MFNTVESQLQPDLKCLKFHMALHPKKRTVCIASTADNLCHLNVYRNTVQAKGRSSMTVPETIQHAEAPTVMLSTSG